MGKSGPKFIHVHVDCTVHNRIRHLQRVASCSTERLFFRLVVFIYLEFLIMSSRYTRVRCLNVMSILKLLIY